MIDVNELDVTLCLPILTPKRKHRQKRIRKKWLKRYGYKTTWINLEGHFVPNEDGSYGFTGVRV